MRKHQPSLTAVARDESAAIEIREGHNHRCSKIHLRLLAIHVRVHYTTSLQLVLLHRCSEILTPPQKVPHILLPVRERVHVIVRYVGRRKQYKESRGFSHPDIVINTLQKRQMT